MQSNINDLIALGFDIGGSTTKVGLVSGSGKVLAIKETPTDVNIIGLDKFLEKLLGLLHVMQAQAGGPLRGIGGTFLGWIDDARTGPFMCSNAPALHGLNLKKLLESEFGLQVVLNDDATAHALAEYNLGSGRGVRRFMSMAMGTGLGIAMIINGESLRFTAGCIGDAGHIILRPGGPTCSTGCKGCGEALIGVAGIERLALEKYGVPKPAREIITGAREGNDPVASEIMKEIGFYSGELLASISHIFLPDRIVLTGGTSTAGQVLLDATKMRFEELVGDYHRTFSHMSEGYYSGVEIVLGSLRGETGVIGAVVDLFD